MTELKILDEDLTRFRTLHSWYKWQHDGTIFPLLSFGQQPYQPISPQTNANYDHELRWYFLINPEYIEFLNVFKNEDVSKKIWNISKKYASIVNICKLGSEDENIVATLSKNASQFYLETKDVYETLKKSYPIAKCSHCLQNYFISFGCFGSLCNHDIFLKYTFKGTMYISKKNEITFANEKDTSLLTFVFNYFKTISCLTLNTENKTIFYERMHGYYLQLRIFYAAQKWHAHIEYENIGPVLIHLKSKCL